ncbi:hypothetical protein [Xanthocytophaga agilis]|uniref:Uncharacterized protein n=1 Tax=Xanthocytophaga agilis TaxID=3048010 RepID=A0AAE3R1U1_9BACT|nr:hypothetical protein [Xanthocytophaga agilis]MDJ1499102.1 hypothetical protein [Xanthocytophaga agilis]
MARHTTASALRKYRSEYYRLMAQEARLNEQLYHMLKRIKAIKADEERTLANHTHLTALLSQATRQKAELEAQPVSKERNKQLKKAESVWKDIHIQYKRSDLRLAVLDRKKDKDNAANYVLKENYRDQVRLRADVAYAMWKELEKIYQRECQQESRLVTEIASLEVNPALQASERETTDIPSVTDVRQEIVTENQAMIVFALSNQCLYILTPVKSFFLIQSVYPDKRVLPVHQMPGLREYQI